MKRLLFSGLVLALAHPALGWQLSFGTLQVPPMNASLVQINDANVTVGAGARLIITNFPNGNGIPVFFGSPRTLDVQTFPFTTSDTRNYTNLGSILINSGVDFRYFPVNPPPPQPGVPFNNYMAGNFVNIGNGTNGGVIQCSGNLPLKLFGQDVVLNGFTLFYTVASEILVSATNLIHSGTMNMDNLGLIDLTGRHVDLTRGTLAMNGVSTPVTFFAPRARDRGIGVDTNQDWNPGIDLTPTTAISSDYFTQLFPFFPQNLRLTNSIPYFENFGAGVPNGPNRTIFRAVFLQDTSTSNVITKVYFLPFFVLGFTFDETIVEWASTYRDPVTGNLATNYLYLANEDFLTASTNNFIFNGVPANFTFFQSAVPQIPFPDQLPGFVPVITPGIATNNYAYVLADVGPITASVTNMLINVTNQPGRIVINALHDLILDSAHITSQNYLSIQSTNQFNGNRGALISSPFTDLNLGVTNGTLTISNLLLPSLPVSSGFVEAWNATWENSFDDGAGNIITNQYRVLLINSALDRTAADAAVRDLRVRATNSLTISDTFNVFRETFIDTTRLTLTTNGPGGFSLAGNLNMVSPDFVWSPSFPRLLFLTNYANISASNFIAFAGGLTSLYSDYSSATPYQAIVNHGRISSQGTLIRSRYLENGGAIHVTEFGSVDAQAICMQLTNGVIDAPIGVVSLFANNITVSNHALRAGAALQLAPTNCFFDGNVLSNLFAHEVFSNTPPQGGLTNGNIWTAGGEFSVFTKPATGDLLGTTVSNTALFLNSQFNTWAGEDRGCSPAGYGNNMALGRLVLNGNTNGAFTFIGTGPGNNAIYVDSLEFLNSTTNRDANGDVTHITIAPGMRIYYAQALAGGLSIAEKINGKNGGGFCWVSNYAGAFSSTNITYTNGLTYTFNEALAESPTIDSDNDGSANSLDATPIPIDVFYDVAVSFVSCDCDPGILGGGTGTGDIDDGDGDSSGGGGSGHTSGTLKVPNAIGSAGPLSFLAAKGTYNGLFSETNGAAPKHPGYFSALVTTKGTFSAKLLMGGRSYAFSGSFNSTGGANGLAVSKGVAPLNVQLQLNSIDGQITGQVSGSGWTARLLANRSGYDSQHPAPSTGKYTLTIPGTKTAGTPRGDGFGTVTVDAVGNVTLSGLLADGTKISQKSAVSKDGAWPLYASLYGGSGSVLSWMQFTNRPGKDDCNGQLLWLAPAGAPGSLYPAGFTNDVNSIGSRYSGSGSPGFFDGFIILQGGGLSSSITNHITLGAANKLIDPPADVTLSITAATGLFKGTAVDPGTGGKLTFQGALFQKQEDGTGFFLNSGQSGQVYFGPLP